MANPARAKGTAWETELLPLLRGAFGPGVERAPLKGAADQGDFLGVPFLHEAKATRVPRFLDWARTARRKDPDWAVLWHGDRRSPDGAPLVLLPLHTYLRLVEEVARVPANP